jgi:ferredoxin like protein
MSENPNLKGKLGKNVFKPLKEPHIRIRPGFEKDPRLRAAIYVCPAGLYTLNSQGAVQLEIDGCLECGTCRIACGTEVLEWNYPAGGTGVQFRFG